MFRFQDLTDFFERRLLTAANRDMDEEKTTSGYEEELQRQRKQLNVVLIPEIKLHRADVQPLSVKTEELPPEQQERSPHPDQEDNESPLIKEEQEELWISQEREQLQGLEEAETNFLFTSVHMKSEDDEEKPQSSLLHQRLTDHMETEAGGEDCRRPEPERSSDLESNSQSDSGSETEDEEDDWVETRDCIKGLKSATDHIAETALSENCPDSSKTNHAVSLTEKRHFSCQECGKEFTRKADLGRHMLVHTKEKPYSCFECGKGFNRKGNLTAHAIVHSEKKPFSCYECGKRFNQKRSLTAHTVVHLNEKPYSCSECGRKFSYKRSLTAHMFVHSEVNPFSCSECGKRFNFKVNLMRHHCSLTQPTLKWPYWIYNNSQTVQNNTEKTP